jgi:orotate phosphoribosyltransferase
MIDQLRTDELLVDGHFAFGSGRHSTALLDRDRLLADPGTASRMGYALAKQFFTAHIETVASPSIRGAGLAQWVAYFLEPRAKVVYATPQNGIPTIAGKLHDLISGRRVLLIDILVISGETIARFAELLQEHNGEVIGMGTLWNSGDPKIGDLRVFGLLDASIATYTREACPRCHGDSATNPTNVPY